MYAENSSVFFNLFQKKLFNFVLLFELCEKYEELSTAIFFLFLRYFFSKPEFTIKTMKFAIVQLLNNMIFFVISQNKTNF